MSDRLLSRLDRWATSATLRDQYLGPDTAASDMEAAAARIRELEAQVATLLTERTHLYESISQRAETFHATLALLQTRAEVADAEVARLREGKPGEIERAVWSAMIWAAANNPGFDGCPEYTDRGNSFAEDEARRTANRIRALPAPSAKPEE